MRAVLVSIAALCVWAVTARAQPGWLTTSVGDREAIVVYMHHSGWLVRTRSHLLVFDPVAAPGADVLDPLGIAASDVAGRRMVVFVSHNHADHWDPSILRWAEDVPGIRFVFGWEFDGSPACVGLGAERVTTSVEGVTIHNVHHAFDRVPESAFLVHVDGVWIYHAGDHSHPLAGQQPTFRSNLEYLRSIAPRVDLLFTPTWGGEAFAIRELRPRVVFPMHSGGREHEVVRWAHRRDIASLGLVLGVAEQGGRCFFYREGGLESCLR